jgi:hypothetical protein
MGVFNDNIGDSNARCWVVEIQRVCGETLAGFLSPTFLNHLHSNSKKKRRTFADK